MNRISLLILLTLLLGCSKKDDSLTIKEIVDKGLQQSENQYKGMILNLQNYPNRFPNSIDYKNELTTKDASDWTSGFFAGSLWLLYENSADSFFLKEAQKYTLLTEHLQYKTNSHDIGFIIYSAYGNGYRLTHNNEYKNVIISASKTMIKPFNPRVGGIRCSDFNHERSQCPILIDNIVTLEMLLFSAENTNDTTFLPIAISQTDLTTKWLVRSNRSCYNVVSFDSITGVPHAWQAQQGYSPESVWARGQSWALYGYTMMYRLTKKPRYLKIAQEIANYLISQPNMPKDCIPYWDFESPNIPNEMRDASSAAIMASALIELSTFVSLPIQKKYLDTAEKQIRTLTSDKYLSKVDTNGNFILKHSVGNYPNNNQIDVPLLFADYYYIEALIRLKKILNNI